MIIKVLNKDLSVCKVSNIKDINLDFYFLAKTDDEISLVCETKDVKETLDREDGWKAMRIEGVLDFSLVGIISKISSLLAQERIPVFVVSTFNTDYILVKENNLTKAINMLEKEGYEIK